MKRLAQPAAVLLALAAALPLAVHVHNSRWTMAADEAVHAIDGLRLYGDLHHGRIADFLADSYFSEPWHPPVNNHLRWYPFVHSWVAAASFLVLGPSDFAARVPSVLFLFGSCLLFYSIARRIAPAHGEWSGLIAAALLLTAPNAVSFFSTGLTEAAVFFMCYLAVLGYVWFLEQPESRRRAALAGAAMAAAVLTKYDHGALVILATGLSELWRARLRPARLLRSRAPLLFGTAALIVALWFAHPAKIAALLDAAEHPFFGSTYLIAANYVATWFLEYSSDPVVAVLMIAALLAGFRYRDSPGFRAVWIFAVTGFVFLALKARFRFRYNIVEAPACVLLAAALLPSWISRAARRTATLGNAAMGALAALAAAGALAGLAFLSGRASLVSAFSALFVRWYNLNPRHWGLTAAPDRFVGYFESLRGAFRYAEFSILAISSALLIVALARILKRNMTAAIAAALLATFVPGAVALYAHAPQFVDWEIGGTPELHRIVDLVHQNTGPRAEILLAGGWNNLGNNALRWYLLTDYGAKDFDAIHVWGATIGSIVLPAATRVAYWTTQLARAPAKDLPDTIVLIDASDRFLYRVAFEQDGAVYRKVLAARGVYSLAASQDFSELGCRVDVYRVKRDSSAAPLQADPTLPPPVMVGLHGWIQTEDAWRQFWNPLLAW